MPNTYAGVSLTAIADATLANIKRKVGPIADYSTDFSPEFMAPGQSAITTRLWSSKTARSYTASSTTYTRDDSTSAAVTVTPSILYSLGDINELVSSGTPINLEAQIAGVGAESVVRGMFTALNALVLNAAYSQKQTVVIADFGADDIIQARATLVAGGTTDDMNTVISAAAFRYLLNSTAVYPQIGPEGADGNFMKFPGIGKVHEVATVDNLSENLYGWTASKDAFAIVARQPKIPVGFAGEVATATDSETGLSIQVRSWFDPATGLYNVWTGSLFGVAAGRAASLVRYVTA